MKKGLIVLSLMCSLQLLAIDLPKEIIGYYKAEVPSFEFEHNDQTIEASSYAVTLYLSEKTMRYHCGKLKLQGEYTTLVHGENSLQLDVHITNEKSIDFTMNLNIDKKKQTILMSGLKGVPDVAFESNNLVFHKVRTEAESMKG